MARSRLTSDQDLARVTRVNLFVVGAEDEVAKLITSLWPCLGTPIVVRHRGEPLRLSPTSPPVGTIVIYDVDTLTRLEQHALKQWLSAENGRARVVSSASRVFAGRWWRRAPSTTGCTIASTW